MTRVIMLCTYAPWNDCIGECVPD